VSRRHEERVLVCAPLGRDGALACSTLERVGVAADEQPTLGALCAALAFGAGALLIADEALSADGVARLIAQLGAQPAWSDPPVVVLTNAERRQEANVLEPLMQHANVTLLERPFGMATMVASVKASLRARARQYAARDVLDHVRNQAEELKRAADERTRLLESEQLARRAAEAATRAKDDFLAVVSHELRTPLSAIMGWTKLLQTGTLTEQKQRHAIAVIDRNTRAQAQLIEDLLDVSRIISGKLSLDVAAVRLADIVNAAVETVRLAAEARRVALFINVAPDVPSVRGDPARLQQVIWNLLHNAIKFTPEGGQVELHVETRAGLVEVEVRDTGRGIDSAFLPYVFDRFRQAESPTTRTTGGLGLGLAICRHLIEQHGGTIEVMSEGTGKGATFTVRLPILAATAGSDARKVRPAPVNGGPPDLRGVRVLVVDDDADSRELLRNAFELCRAEVLEASSAPEGLETLLRVQPRILVSDVGMPGEDGYSLMRRVRALPPPHGQTPAVALTAFARPEDQALAFEAGFQTHLSKPVHTESLLAAVAALVLKGSP
jgi:signal transduction histidine kinase/CheY-like chemotaxis protein